jgi:hypothetical protein
MGPDPNPERFFREAGEVFEQAQARAGQIEHSFGLGAFHVRLRFAGPALVRQTVRALQHLPPPPSTKPDLTIRVWDSVSTDTVMVPPPWSNAAYRQHGMVEGLDQDGRFLVVFQWYCHALHVLDLVANEALFWVRSSAQVPRAEAGAPLRTIFHLWAGARGMVLVHAAAVGRPDGGVLLVGKAGAGKSTSALASLPSPLLYLSDDTCFVQNGSPPQSLSLYSTARTDTDGLGRFAFPASWVSNPRRSATEKAICFLHEHAAHKLLLSCPVRAILIVNRIADEQSALRPASGGAVLAAMAPSTLLQLPSGSQGSLNTLAAIASKVPGYHFDLGTSVEGIPEPIVRLLDHQPELPT